MSIYLYLPVDAVHLEAPATEPPSPFPHTEKSSPIEFDILFDIVFDILSEPVAPVGPPRAVQQSYTGSILRSGMG